MPVTEDGRTSNEDDRLGKFDRRAIHWPSSGLSLFGSIPCVSGSDKVKVGGVSIGELRPPTGVLCGLNATEEGSAPLNEGAPVSREISLWGILRGMNTMGEGAVAMDVDVDVEELGRTGGGLGEIEIARNGLGLGPSGSSSPSSLSVAPPGAILSNFPLGVSSTSP